MFFLRPAGNGCGSRQRRNGTVPNNVMDQLAHYWLFTLCRLIEGVDAAAVFALVPDQDDPLRIAAWPGNREDAGDLAALAATALGENGCVVRQHQAGPERDHQSFDLIACPLASPDPVRRAVALRLTSRVAARQQVALRQIEEASTWFTALAGQRASASKDQLITMIELVASCLEHDHLQGAATEVASELAGRLDCDRVSIGFLRGHNARVEAVSHSAGFDRKANLHRQIGEAMDEAMEQHGPVVFPEPAGSIQITRRHAALAARNAGGGVLTVPFAVGGRIVGAVLAERPAGRPFDQATIEAFGHIVALVGPVLEVRRRDEQGLMQRTRAAASRSLHRLFGPGHPTVKLALGAAALCLLVLTLATATYRVTCDARLEARTQRVVVAPQDGFVAAAGARPGDIVRRDDLLGALDDRDLRLEHRRWSSQLEQLRAEYRNALAGHDRSQAGILSARMRQAEAQLNLVTEKLARTRLTAPLDGLVVSGDLSQALGAPVERGQVLFTVAPLEAYRVMLEVDERDIAAIRDGQHGRLAISSLPDQLLPFAVEKITPVSTAEEGRTFFRVEAKLAHSSDLFRPGMEGIAKIDVERRSLLWIWGHRLTDWLRLALWSVRP